MNTKLFLGLFIALLFATTTSAEAYVSGTKTAIKLTDDYSLFTVGFKWGFADRDLLIPVIATKGLQEDTSAKAVGYEVENESGLRIKHGTTTAFVVANLPIEDGYYRLPAGKTAEFNLLALHEVASSTQKLKLQVTALPFVFKTKDKEIKTYLHKHELEGYQTNSI